MTDWIEFYQEGQIKYNDIAVIFNDPENASRLIAKARLITNDLGGYLKAAGKMSEAQARHIIRLGVDKVFITEELERFTREQMPLAVLADPSSAVEITQLAHVFKKDLFSSVFDLYLDSRSCTIVYRVKSFYGRMIVDYNPEDAPRFAVVVLQDVAPAKEDASRNGEIITC